MEALKDAVDVTPHETTSQQYDVIVVGSGNAALSAAASAAESGARVIVLEKAPEEWMGGNSRYTGGLFRAAYRDLGDLEEVIAGGVHASEEVVNRSYPREDYWADIMRLTHETADRDLTTTYIDRSVPTLRWLASLGVQFMLAGPDPYGTVNPGAAIWVKGAGRHLVAALTAACQRLGVTFAFSTQVVDLIVEAGAVTGVVCRTGASERLELHAPSVILGCGGFEASARLRAAYLGSGWEGVRVRGTRFNTGDLLGCLERLGAQMTGGWADCHATPVSALAPSFGDDHNAAEDFARHDYSYGVMVNVNGERFIDEGETFRLYTYAKTGRAILAEPRSTAYQVFDQKVVGRLDHRYATETPRTGNTLEELGGSMDVDLAKFLATMDAFNRATAGHAVDFTRHDGAGYRGDGPPKTNWAQPLDSPPFVAYPVACGITFTYGGVRTDTSARVLDGRDLPITGLFAVGEIQGGLFRYQYAGGAGLMRGAVFGRIAGACAAEPAAAHVEAARA